MTRVTPEGWHPLLLSTELIPPVLAGIKTVTRRLVRFPKDFYGGIESGLVYDNSPFGLKYSTGPDTVERLISPFGTPGDTLWVKEAYTVDLFGRNVYHATDGDKDGIGRKFTFTSSRFMPFAVHRIELRVIGVGVERLHDITEEDAKCEGVLPGDFEFHNGMCKTIFCNTYRGGFFAKWVELHGLDNFRTNPFVWIVKFERINP